MNKSTRTVLLVVLILPFVLCLALVALPIIMFVSGGKPPGSGATNPTTGEIAALREKAATPGPAVGALAAMAPYPWRPAYQLPFAEDAAPGFAAATHRLNYEQFYLQHLHDWLTSERELLELAASLAKAPDTEFTKSAERAMALSENLRRSANHCVLYEVYWNHFLDPVQGVSKYAGDVARGLNNQRDRYDSHWIVCSGQYAYSFSEDHSVSFGYSPAAAVNCMPQAWALDFTSFAAYAEQLSKNMKRGAVDSLMTLYHWPSSFAEVPAYALADAARAKNDRFSEDLKAIIDARYQLDPGLVEQGLRRIAGPKGYVLILERTGTNDRTFAILRDEATPSGIFCHQIVSAAKGR